MTPIFEGEPLDEKRSRHMATIRGKDTKPELALRREVWRLGGRFRTHDRSLPGIPDLSNRRARVAVFVDGCFWHGCPQHYTKPKTRAAYWAAKVERNQATRRRVLGEYPDTWKVHQAFECQLREGLHAAAVRVASDLRDAKATRPQRPAVKREL